MAERIPQHKHCNNCGKAVPVSETLCSENCKEQWEAVIKKRMLHYRIFLLSVAAVIALMVFGGGV